MPGSRILLTGADSLPGSHILDLLLSDSNLSVRAVTRSEETAYIIPLQHRQGTLSTLDLTVIPEAELALPGAFDTALVDNADPFHAVIHTLTASPSDQADCLANLINLETETVIQFLRSVQVFAKEVRRVVIVTSLTPYARWLAEPQVDRNRRGPVDVQGTVRVDPEYVLATSKASDNIIYEAVSKWLRESGARFDIAWTTAPSIYGPSIRRLETSSDLLEANRRVWNILSNERRERMEAPPYGITHFLDVRDLALGAVRAVFNPQAGGKRFFITAGIMPSGSEIAKLLVASFPGLQGRVRMDGSPPVPPLEEDPSLDMTDTYLATTILGFLQYYSAEQTLTDTARQIVDLQQRKDWRRIIQS
ncbi:NAD(P)-binding protein [Pyrenochaeta sp. DS3sAY3a]|nr:NAD(P)-binding protein [Pyrenochaeta sp. DS3sAY3a]